MKKYIFIVLAAPLLASFAIITDGPDKTRKTGLKYDAKSVVSVSYRAELKFDELVKGKRIDSILQTYNANGDYLSFVYYGTKDYPAHFEEQTKYNVAGNKTERTTRGEGLNAIRTEYLYDQGGNLIETNDYDHLSKLSSKVKYKYNSKGQLFYSTEYYPNGARTSRTFFFYNSAGQQVVEATVDENNVLKEQHVIIRDSLSRAIRILTYNSCLLLKQTMDYFYKDTTDTETGLIIRKNPINDPLGDSVRYSDNGVISQPGRVFTLDENGIIQQCSYVMDDQTITDSFENGVLRITEIKNKDGYNYKQTFNALGAISRYTIDYNGILRMDAKYTYDDTRALTAIEDPKTKTAARISYDREGRITGIKMYEETSKLDRSYRINYDTEGFLSSSELDYVDPSKTDKREEYELYSSYTLKGDDPLWWMDGLMIVTVHHKYTYSSDGTLAENFQYGHGNTHWSTFEYKKDSRGHWTYSLETNKITGKPERITERKIYYR